MSPAHQELVIAWTQSGMSVRLVAAKAGVHENTVLRVFAGRDTRYSTIAAIAGALGVSSLPTA